TEDATKLGRNLPADNNKEIIKLDDYRKRYVLYREMAKQNVDVIIHLGDYIYEYGQMAMRQKMQPS
ncbi:alkaline phosphatase D family protein, partial [Pseudomonas aeruginosa]|uniref:alkaline phosphatase D family protein n=1 Tax=Pseudomonas aeruginosa TaxID=287 RepID=UPI00265DE209